MSDNKYAKVIRIIGFVLLVGGIILSFILGGVFKIEGLYSEKYNWYIACAGSIFSFVGGVVFLGFAEIIDLLQANCDKQEEIIREIKHTENSLSKTIIVNHTDEDNTPKQTANRNNAPTNGTGNIAHTWYCENCHKMISASPCPYCGYDTN